MPNPKEIRKELWDYLKAQGIEINSTQHEAIKEIMERYIETASGIRKNLYNSAMGELEVARKGFNEWRKARAERSREKNRRKQENRAARDAGQKL